MMPFTPMNDNVDRVVENLERGVPEDDAPAMEGGIGADEQDLTPGEEALKEEGSLDQEVAEETSKK